MSRFLSYLRISSLLICAAVLLFIRCGGERKYSPVGSKLIILGFDGVDPTLMNRWMAEGKLPNLARLKEVGDYRELGSTIPPQSPVAWSSFATGTNPGGHGIYDFVNRDPQTYMPGITTMKLEQPEIFLGLFQTQKAQGIPTRGGTSFWKVAADSGVHSTLLTIPYAFPPEEIEQSRMLCGLGVPDLRETNSTFTYFATDLTPEELAEPVGGGRLVKVEKINGEIGTYLEAMIHPKSKERVRIPVNFSIRDDQSVEVRLEGNTFILKPGTWSEWVPFHLKMAAFMKIAGICRFHLFTSGPEFRLYVTPLSIDPHSPYMPISYPESFAPELFEKVGYFKTVGWEYDTSALNEERLTDEQFFEDMKFTTAERERIFLSEMDEKDWDLFIAVFTDTDRSAHMFWRFLDPQSPLYDAVAVQQMENPIEWTYRHMDEFVGQVMEKYVDDQTTLIILSDHGFHSYRRSFNINTWLAQNGYLTFKGMEKLSAGQPIPADMYPKEDFFPQVVWRQTRAYALGTGQIYVNLMGREANGIVKPGEEYNQLVAEISQKLLEVRDPQDNQLVIKAVYKGKEVYQGDFIKDEPDLQLGYHDGFRTSKETMLGGIPSELLTNNLNKWSGDHSASAVEETSGILFSNRKIMKDNPSIIDIAPTVLEFFGKQKLPVMEGSSIFSDSLTVATGIASKAK